MSELTYQRSHSSFLVTIFTLGVDPELIMLSVSRTRLSQLDLMALVLDISENSTALLIIIWVGREGEVLLSYHPTTRPSYRSPILAQFSSSHGEIFILQLTHWLTIVEDNIGYP